jgi:transposase-like protein
MKNPSPFKWRQFEAEIILLCVRWYLRYSLSYRDLPLLWAMHIIRLISWRVSDT